MLLSDETSYNTFCFVLTFQRCAKSSKPSRVVRNEEIEELIAFLYLAATCKGVFPTSFVTSTLAPCYHRI